MAWNYNDQSIPLGAGSPDDSPLTKLQQLISKIPNLGAPLNQGMAPQQGLVDQGMMPHLPTSKWDILAAAAAPVLGAAVSHYMKTPLAPPPRVEPAPASSSALQKFLAQSEASAPDPTQAARTNVNELINARDSVYHATDMRGFHGIMDSGQILPFGGNQMYEGWNVSPSNLGQDVFRPEDMGVSVSRVPRIASKGNKFVSFVLDNQKMPSNKPLAEPGYTKTAPVHRSFGDDIMENAYPHEVEAYNNALSEMMQGDPHPGMLKAKAILDQVKGRLDTKMNKQFEFENRTTFGKSIPLKSVKGIVVDKAALRRAVDNDTEGFWPHEVGPEPAFWGGIPDETLDKITDYHISKMRQRAVQAGLPFRVAENGRQLHSYRAGFSKMKAQGKELWGLGAGAGATGLAMTQGSSDSNER